MSRHFLQPASSSCWVPKPLMLESVSVLLFVPHMMHMLGLFNVLLPKSTLFGMNFILWKVIHSTHSNQKHLVVPKGNGIVGWLPGEDQYVKIQQTKVPAQDEVFRHISFEPETAL